MEEIVTALRILLGAVLVVLSADSLFFHKINHKSSERGSALMKAFRDTGYLGNFIQATELVVGLMLVTGFFVPLALVILAPISINVVLFHVFLDTSGMAPALFVFLVNIFLAWSYAASYAPLLHR